MGGRRSLMTLTLHEITVPVFLRTLKALTLLVGKAEAHCAENGEDPRRIIAARLAADMKPFAFQITAVIGNSVGATARLQGLEVRPPEMRDGFAAMTADLDEARAWLGAVRPEDLEGAEDREIVLPHPRGARHFTGRGYLLSLAIPNFFFHAATAYDLLRTQGLELGKRDFLGELPPRRPVAQG